MSALMQRFPTWRGRRHLLAIACCFLGTYGTASAARADDDANREAAAEALFQEARALVREGRVAEACPKFAESHRIDPGIGVLFFLADCYEKNGQTASAWATFRSASAAAKVARQPDREREASQRAGALERQLSKVTIVVPETARLPGLEVRWDGLLFGSALFGSWLPVDPGVHSLQATAPGRQSRETKVRVDPGAREVTIELPLLSPLPEARPSTPMQPPLDERRPGLWQDAPRASPEPLGPQRITAIAMSGAGLVGLGIGTVFGLKTLSSWQDAKSHCSDGPPPLRCDERGIELRDSAHSAGTIATIAFSTGALALGAGAVLWFTAPQNGAPKGAARAFVHVSAGSGAAISAGTTF